MTHSGPRPRTPYRPSGDKDRWNPRMLAGIGFVVFCLMVLRVVLSTSPQSKITSNSGSSQAGEDPFTLYESVRNQRNELYPTPAGSLGLVDEGILFRSDEHHFAFTYPTHWRVRRDRGARMPGTIVLVSDRSQGASCGIISIPKTFNRTLSLEGNVPVDDIIGSMKSLGVEVSLIRSGTTFVSGIPAIYIEVESRGSQFDLALETKHLSVVTFFNSRSYFVTCTAPAAVYTSVIDDLMMPLRTFVVDPIAWPRLRPDDN